MTKALYPYTLKPIALNMSETEFYAAQLSLFEKGTSHFTLKSLKRTEWIVIALAYADFGWCVSACSYLGYEMVYEA